METVITVAVILAMIAVGAYVIGRLNAGHDERIAAFHYSRFLPGGRRRGEEPGSASPPPATGSGGPK